MREYFLDKELYGFSINSSDDDSMMKPDDGLNNIYRETSNLIGGKCVKVREIIFPIRYNVTARYINLSKDEIAEILSKIQGIPLNKIVLNKNNKNKIIELLDCPKMSVYCHSYEEKRDVLTPNIISIFEIECSDINIKSKEYS